MFNWLIKPFLRFKKQPCRHQKNYNQINWVASDGTLMTQTLCLDCQHVDEGHVYGEDDNNDWGCQIAVRDGRLVARTKKNEPPR